MSSSSIEVMGGEDMQMMLMAEEENVAQMEDDNDQSNFEDNGMGMDDTDELGIPPGAIIFSPQDSTGSFAAKAGSSRGRKKGSSNRKGTALTIKMEEGVDYSKINLPVACEICGKLMANGRVLVQHIATHSVNKAFQCPHCPKSFTRMVHLQGHLVFHGIQKQFECPVCHQRFSRQDCVRVHMRLHDKSKCVFCGVCHKAFLTVGALNIHMRIHRGEKPFKCHLCGKCFTQKNHVITHIKRHTKVSDTPFQKKLGPRMFQCEHCPRSFIRLSDYERHVQWNHGAVSEGNASTIQNNTGDVLGVRQESIGVGTTLEDMLISNNDLTLNSKVRKKGMSFSRRNMCSIGTQTDDDGGHVIIPRKYQNVASMTSEGTQMSAPATPRHEEDMYENDIYDEGMDRNYSSDEDEILEESDGIKPDITPVSLSTQETGSSANDEAFDAVLGKGKPTVELQTDDNLEVLDDETREMSDIEEDLINSQESLLSLAKSEPTPVATKIEENFPKQTLSTQNKFEKPKQALVTRLTNKPSLFKQIPDNKPVPLRVVIQNQSNDTSEHDPMIREDERKTSPSVATFNRPAPVKILDTFNTKNWRGRGRGRGRTRTKGIIGLTGATHLRLIRKSMMNFITEKTEQMNESIKKAELLSEQSDKKTKRQGKAKPHDKDFVCNSKSCEMCNPSENLEEEQQDEVSIEIEEAKPTEPAKDQSAKLLQFLVSGDAKNLHGTDFRLLHDTKLSKPSNEDIQLALTASMENPSVSTDNNGQRSDEAIRNLRQRAEFFSAKTVNDDDFVSPPVELQSFCIPTYSCKLCGREFRFEGKLHRHIEAVHQKKEIFSPDVKPGRGSARYNEREMTTYESDFNIAVSNNIATVVKQTVQQNPEIEALRSEWDDDDNDGDMFGADHKPVIPTTASAVAAMAIREHQETRQHKVSAVNPKDIVAVNNDYSDVYLGGVKLNINKLSGLAEFEQFSRKNIEPELSSSQQPIPIEQKEDVPDTLDTKCQKLLQKLFDHTLLVDCGLYQEHVSVVLGKVLQHYGVKMIEDYGQGQYEVLKYNLWRLIEWKVTMEQMEEFYTDGKSVEEMMDDIMNGRVPIIAHHEMIDNSEQQQVEQVQQHETEGSSSVETVQISNNQLMLSQVGNVLSGQLNLGDGVTQVVLAQDVSPELLQGAHIVTIDPATGQVLSQVTADQVILSDELGQQIQTLDGQVIVSQSSTGVVTSLPPGSIVSTNITDTNHESKL